MQKGEIPITGNTNTISNNGTDRSEQNMPRGTYLLMGLITAYLMVFSVVPNEFTAFFAIALPLAFALAFLHSRFVAIAVGASALLSLLFVGSLIGAASVVSTVFIIGMGATAMLHLKPFVSVLMGIVAYGVSLIFAKDLIASAYVFLWIPCALLLAILLARGANRVTAICAVSAMLVAVSAVPLLIQLYSEYGELSAATFTAFFSDLRAEYLQAYLDSLFLLPEKMQATMTEELFHTVFDTIISLLPAILVITTNSIAFFAHMLSLTVCRKTGYAKRFPLKAHLFIMSKVSAILFIITLLLPILGLGNSDNAQVITVAAENINLMLMPAFLLVGGFGVIAFFQRQRGCLNIWVLLALAFLLLYAGGFVLYALALFGAFHTLRTPSRLIGDN